MAVTVTFHRLATKEYLEARRWYSRRSTRVANSFRIAVDQAVAKIVEAPRRWPAYGDRFHWVRTRRFPYLLFYHMFDEEHVLVIAVAHGRRRPDIGKDGCESDGKTTTNNPPRRVL